MSRRMSELSFVILCTKTDENNRLEELSLTAVHANEVKNAQKERSKNAIQQEIDDDDDGEPIWKKIKTEVDEYVSTTSSVVKQEWNSNAFSFFRQSSTAYQTQDSFKVPDQELRVADKLNMKIPENSNSFTENDEDMIVRFLMRQGELIKFLYVNEEDLRAFMQYSTRSYEINMSVQNIGQLLQPSIPENQSIAKISTSILHQLPDILNDITEYRFCEFHTQEKKANQLVLPSAPLNADQDQDNDVKTYIFFDTETTGLEKDCKILEIGLIAINHKDMETLAKQEKHEIINHVDETTYDTISLVMDPGKPIPKGITETKNGFTNQAISASNKPEFNIEVVKLLEDFCARQEQPFCFLAFNGYSFHFSKFQKHLDNIGYTSELFNKNFKCDPLRCMNKLSILRGSLEDRYKEIMGHEIEGRHTAEGDAKGLVVLCAATQYLQPNINSAKKNFGDITKTPKRKKKTVVKQEEPEDSHEDNKPQIY